MFMQLRLFVINYCIYFVSAQLIFDILSLLIVASSAVIDRSTPISFSPSIPLTTLKLKISPGYSDTITPSPSVMVNEGQAQPSFVVSSMYYVYKVKIHYTTVTFFLNNSS